ncbi:MAG: lytic transglycosylase domain-containing protein [Oleiphilaceae bacterium]|nr:lytic transglycosylase domain-containing protein [Oleiphilaceae bacterium]
MTGLVLLWPAAALAEKPTDDPRLRQMLQEAITQSSSFQDRFDAEVWLVDMSSRIRRYVRDEEERLTILRLVHREATRHDLSPELVLAVIHVESLFERFAVSSAGAMGIMQIMPFWKNEIGREDDNLMRIETNLRYGTTILRYYIDRENGDLTRALARYNGSLGKTWYPERVFNALEQFYHVNY